MGGHLFSLLGGSYILKSLAHYYIEIEVIEELNKIIPSGKRSTFVNEILKTYLEEIKKRPEGKNPSSFAENQQSMVSEETKEVSDIV